MKTKFQSRLFVALLALVVSMTIACSGSPTGPTPTPASLQTGPPVNSGSNGTLGTAVQVVSENTGQPIAGATVTAENPKMSLITDGEGKVQFPQALTRTSRILIEAPGYLTRTASQNTSGVYGILGPRGDVPNEFLQEFVLGDTQGRGNTAKPRNNRIEVVLDNPIFQAEDITRAFNNACDKIRAVGYGCEVQFVVPSSISSGTLTIFRYGGETGDTSLTGGVAGADSTWTVRGDLRSMRSESAILYKLIRSLGLYGHSYPGGVGSKVQPTADFSAWEKQAIALYMPRRESVCFEDMVMLDIANVVGATCGRQAPFIK